MCPLYFNVKEAPHGNWAVALVGNNVARVSSFWTISGAVYVPNKTDKQWSRKTTRQWG